jgi:hypothetical protein
MIDLMPGTTSIYESLLDGYAAISLVEGAH